MIDWLLPGNFPETTGAIVFDRRLAAAIGPARGGVCFEALPGHHPLPDETARAAAARIIAARSTAAPPAPLVIDGFCLYAFAEETEGLRSAIAIMHHPMSAEPQLPESDRAVFAAIERRLLPALRHIFVPGETVRQYLTNCLGIPADRVTLLTPGVPDTPRSTGSGGPGCHLLAVASLIPRKGYETVLAALARLTDLNWTLTICGDATIDTEHAAALRARAEHPLLAERVRFLGPQTEAGMEALWQSADVFVSGSVFEGYGMAVAEAVRHGLPLVITRSAAAPEVIPDNASALVEPGDAAQLSKALRRLIFDQALRQSLADASWQAGQRFPDWPTQAARFTALLG